MFIQSYHFSDYDNCRRLNVFCFHLKHNISKHIETHLTVQTTISEAIPLPGERIDGGSDAEDHWQAIRDTWRDVRDQIESIIANIEDGRRRRPYNDIPRYKYLDVIDRLFNDGKLTKAQADAANNMNQLFFDLRPTGGQLNPRRDSICLPTGGKPKELCRSSASYLPTDPFCEELVIHTLQ